MDSVISFVRAMPFAPTFEPAQEAALLLMETPLQEPETIEARTTVSGWLRSLASLDAATDLLRKRRNEVQDILAPHAAQNASEGLTGINPMAARSGQSVLAELRADDELMASMVKKGHEQLNYLRALRRNLALAESISDLLASDTRR